MSLTEDQLRVKALVLESVTFLCKNGLQFTSELKIEGLIAITVDNKQVVLVNFNEGVLSPTTKSAGTSTISKQLSREQKIKPSVSIANANVIQKPKFVVRKCFRQNKKPTVNITITRTKTDDAVSETLHVEKSTLSSKRLREGNQESEHDYCQTTLDMEVEDELLGVMDNGNTNVKTKATSAAHTALDKDDSYDNIDSLLCETIGSSNLAMHETSTDSISWPGGNVHSTGSQKQPSVSFLLFYTVF